MITLARLKNWAMEKLSTLDVASAVKQANEDVYKRQDYIVRKAAESSLLGLSQTLSRSPLTDEIEARGEAAYRPNRWEKGTGWMLGTAADTLMMGCICSCCINLFSFQIKPFYTDVFYLHSLWSYLHKLWSYLPRLWS